MNVANRINRVLSILSIVSRNQGISVEDLAQKVGMKSRNLMRELDFISLVGKPPFKPDDYVDIYVENKKVFVEFDQKLNRPLRFTKPEAIAILLSLELLDPEVDLESVKSLKKKMEDAIKESVDSYTPLREMVLLDNPTRLVSEYFTTIREAIASHQKLLINYFSLNKNQIRPRTIRPYLLNKNLGNWYLTGYCELRKDLRTFRFERIQSVENTGKTFPYPEDFDTEKYSQQQSPEKFSGKFEVEIFFDSYLAPWIREEWPSQVRESENGGVILTMYCDSFEFSTRLVLGSSPHAKPLSPEKFVSKVRAEAREIIACMKKTG